MPGLTWNAKLSHHGHRARLPGNGNHYYSRATNISSGLDFTTTNQTLLDAQAVVKAALKETAASNKERFENPRRNQYILRPESSTNLRRDIAEVNGTVAKAAVIVAEFDAKLKSINGTLRRDYNQIRANAGGAPLNVTSTGGNTLLRKRSGFWMEDVHARANLGTWPFGDADYKVSAVILDESSVCI
jgi:hypothetical protein